MKFTQNYWKKLTEILMDRRYICINSTDIKRAPFDRFREFLHHLASRNAKNHGNNDA